MDISSGEGVSRSETDEVPIICIMTFSSGEGGSRSETDEVCYLTDLVNMVCRKQATESLPCKVSMRTTQSLP